MSFNFSNNFITVHQMDYKLPIWMRFIIWLVKELPIVGEVESSKNIPHFLAEKKWHKRRKEHSGN